MLASHYKDRYCYIECNKIDNLKDSDYNVTFYSIDQSNYYNYNIKKGNNKDKIEIKESSYSDNWQTFQLKSKPIIKPYQKSPTRGDYQVWNEETKKLLSVLTEKKEEINNFWQTFSDSFCGNLFVNKENANNWIKSNIYSVINNIEKYMIEINNLRNNYQQIYKDR